MCHCWKKSRLRCHQALSVSQSQSLEQGQHWALCWVLQAGVSHGKCHGKHSKACTSSPTLWGPCYCKSPLGIEPGLLWKAKGWKSEGLDFLYFLCISIIIQVKIILLTCSCCHLRVGVIPGTAALTKWSVWPWLQCLALDRGARMTLRCFPQILSPQWAGCAQEHIPHPEQATCVLVLADVEQQLLLQMFFALLKFQECWILSNISRHPLCWERELTAFGALHVAKYPLISRLTGLLIRVSCQSPAGDRGKRQRTWQGSLCAHLCTAFSMSA